MRQVVFIVLAIVFGSCLKELDNSELNRNSIFDPNGANAEPWFEQTGNVTSIPQIIVPSNVQHIFRYKVTNQILIDNRANFEIIYNRFSGSKAFVSAFRPLIFKENGHYYFEVSAYNFTNPDGNFCFGFSLNQIGQNISSSELLNCWKL